MCTENKKAVFMCLGGFGITNGSLWIKGHVIHRRVYAHLFGLLIKRAKACLSTGLNQIFFFRRTGKIVEHIGGALLFENAAVIRLL
jgi:hypothetical protein